MCRISKLTLNEVRLHSPGDAGKMATFQGAAARSVGQGRFFLIFVWHEVGTSSYFS